MTHLRDVYKKLQTQYRQIESKRKMYHANINPKKAGMNILISDKVDVRAKKIARQRMPIM